MRGLLSPKNIMPKNFHQTPIKKPFHYHQAKKKRLNWRLLAGQTVCFRSREFQESCNEKLLLEFALLDCPCFNMVSLTNIKKFNLIKLKSEMPREVIDRRNPLFAFTWSGELPEFCLFARIKAEIELFSINSFFHFHKVKIWCVCGKYSEM